LPAAALLAGVALLAGCSAATGAADVAGTPGAHVTSQPTSVSALAPAKADVTQQPSVTITGSGLSKVASVQFGDQEAVKIHSRSTGKLVVQAPTASNYQPATVDITLLDKKGDVIATKPDAYSYTASSGVAAQLQYALAHWNNYNTAQYGDLNPVGGDCANFVSQTLIARGWQMNDDWYNHDAAGDWSPAWGYVPAMDEYFADNASDLGLQKLSFDQRDQVALGDVAIFDWDGDGSPDHVQVVTDIKKVDGQTKIEMASHNDDYDYRDLDTTITEQHPGATGHFWHLTR